MVKQSLLAAVVMATMVCAVVGRVEALDIQGYAQAAVDDYKSMKGSLGIDAYEAKVKRAGEMDDEYDRQHPENRTSSVKNEIQAYTEVVSDGYGKLFSALGSYEFDKARVLARDSTIEEGVGKWYTYRQPGYEHIDASAIGKIMESYVPGTQGAKDINDYDARLKQKIAESISSFTEQHDRKMNDFFKKVCKDPWTYYDDYKKKEVKATFLYPKCVERKSYFPEDYREYNLWYLGGIETILNYDFWAEEGLAIHIWVGIWSSDDQESSVSGMFKDYEMIDQSGDTMILERKKYKECKLVHNYKGRKSLAVIYQIDGADELAKKMAFYLKDYLVSGAVSAEVNPEEQAGAEEFKIEAMDTTSLAASPGKPDTCRLKVSVARRVKDENGKIVVRPAAGAEVNFEKPRLGKLSAAQAVTDANGEAMVVYQAPSEEELADNNRVTVDITVRGKEPGEHDYMPISVENVGAKISAEAEHEILPSLSKFYSQITFKFRGPDKEYKAIVSTQQKDGALVQKQDEAGGTGRLEMQVRPGSTNEVFYHWVGDQEMTSAREDVVTIEIPELKLKQELKISVGIDLQMLRVENRWKEPVIPGVYHPFKVYVNDVFHPKADAAELFKKFYFKAHLKVKQEYFEPVTIYDPEKEDWLPRLMAHIDGAVIPQGALVRDLIDAKLEKSEKGESFLIAEDLKEDKSVEAAFPGFIPYDRGNYQFAIQLVCDYDSNKSNNQILSQVIDVSQYSVHEEMLNGFLLPTAKSYVSMVPYAGSVLFGIDTGVKIQQGKYKEAIVDTALMIGSDVAGEWIDTKRMEILEKPYKEIVAKATRTPLDKLGKKELAYCLKRAKEQYAGDLGGAVIGWTIDKAKEKIEEKGPVRAAQPAGFEFLRLFLKGYGDYGLIAITKDGLKDCSFYDQKGQKLTNAPAQVFSGPAEGERVFDEKEVIVVPFKLDEEIRVQAEGTGGPGNIITITPEKVSTHEYSKTRGQYKMKVNKSGAKEESVPESGK